jgi:hypothetical protein
MATIASISSREAPATDTESETQGHRDILCGWTVFISSLSDLLASTSAETSFDIRRQPSAAVGLSISPAE